MRFFFITVLVIFTKPVHAQPKQTLRVLVTDEASGSPVGFASADIFFTGSSLTAVADSTGNFDLQLPVGRYSIRVTAAGYNASITSDVMVGSGKETALVIPVKQNTGNLAEVILKPVLDKRRSLNRMATVSAGIIRVEEARNYAGGFDDPARLATTFAGVTSNSNDNGIIVRGNAPKFLQWKMEGIEIPNPNHFSDLRMIGGGTLTALSSQVMGNSDFFTGAFPAEYNNALSGIFDMAMKAGNYHRNEYTLQAGVTGLDAAAEGPFKAGHSSSYLVNYRYSTLALLAALLPENANSLRYQDLSFKLNFPAKKSGTFTIWGIALADKAGAKAKPDSMEWQYATDKQQDDIKLFAGAAGISHKYFFGNNSFIKTTIAATANNSTWQKQELDQNLLLTPESNISIKNYHFILSSFINKKFSPKHTNKTGILVTGMYYDLGLFKSNGNSGALLPVVNTSGTSVVFSAYSASSFQLSGNTMLNIGISGQLFMLNHHAAIEPRAGIRRQINNHHSIAIAYGLHSRLENLNYYLNNNLQTGAAQVNRNLDFTRAHHVVLSYDCTISDRFHLKVEPYCQFLFSVPVIADSSFSLLNLQDDWFFAQSLVNTGKGRNMGVDISFERYFSKGGYFSISGSLFKAEYTGGDGVWRNTRYNRNYIVNALAGKEWQAGKKAQNVFRLNIRCSIQGGNHYSPVDARQSYQEKEIVYDEFQAFSRQAPPVFNAHLTASYRINKTNRSTEIAVKILNLTAQPDFYGYRYNLQTHTADKDLSSVVIPNISYRIEF